MKRTGEKVMAMAGFFRAVERATYTDGKELFVKIKGEYRRIEECGTAMKYNKEAQRMLEVPAYWVW